LFIGTSDCSLSGCRIRWIDELFVLEEPVLLTARTANMEKALKTPVPRYRKSQFLTRNVLLILFVGRKK
jgi:hypothetical protein